MTLTGLNYAAGFPVPHRQEPGGISNPRAAVFPPAALLCVWKPERMTELQPERPVRNDPFWPAAVITFGISLTAARVTLLGYGLVRLVDLAI